MARASNKQFESTVMRHFDALYRLAYRLTGNVADAEDLVQDTCLKAYMRLGELEEFEHPRAWILRVQYRLFLDADRRRKRSPIRALDEAIEESSFMASQAPSPEEHADGIALAQRLQGAWARLEKSQQALLALHAEGYSLPELQGITGIPRDALKARLQRARTRLTKILNTYTVPIVASSGEPG
jgi:RNA polymerase sigma-70 factor (ECF subfamily)